MRWMKHLTTAGRDEKLRQIIDNFGMEGYGAYWLILEAIGEKITKEITDPDQVFLTLSERNWRKFVNFSPKKFQKFLESSKKLKLFFPVFDKENPKLITIKCPKLLKYRDEYTGRGKKTPDKILTKSGVAPDKVRRDSRPRDRDRDRDRDRPPLPPIEKIAESYHQHLPNLSIVILDPLIAKQIDDILIGGGSEKQNISWWDDYFEVVSQCPYLCGNGPNGWKATFSWLINPDNMAKVVDGNYSTFPRGDYSSANNNAIKEFLDNENI